MTYNEKLRDDWVHSHEIGLNKAYRLKYLGTFPKNMLGEKVMEELIKIKKQKRL